MWTETVSGNKKLRIQKYLIHRKKLQIPIFGYFRLFKAGGGGGGPGLPQKFFLGPPPPTVSPNIFFSALRASVWSKNKGARAPPLDPPTDSLVTADEKARTV